MYVYIYKLYIYLLISIATHICIYCKIRLTSIPLLQDHAPWCQILLLKLQNCTLHCIIWNPKMEMISLFNYCDFLGSMFIFQGVLLYRNSSHPRYRIAGNAILACDGRPEMHRFCESLHLLATDMLRWQKQGVREKESCSKSMKGISLTSKKDRFSNQPKRILSRSFNNQHVFVCLFLMKKRFVRNKKLTIA